MKLKDITLFVLIIVSVSSFSSCLEFKDFADFESYYKGINPTVNALELKLNKNGRIGVYAKVDIDDQMKSKGALFSIPSQLMITQNTVKSSNVGQFIKPLENDLFDYEIITIWYTYQSKYGHQEINDDNLKDNLFNSFNWDYYLKTLPRFEEMHNIFQFNEDELKLLNGSYQYDVALRTLDRSKQSYKILEEKLDPTIFKDCIVDYTTWKNALSVIFSIKLNLHDYEKKIDFSALVPFFDLFAINEYYDVTKWYSSKGVLYAYLDDSVKAGKELFREIGTQCNAEHLIYHGVIYENSYKPCLSIPKSIVDLKYDGNDVLYQRRTEFGNQYQLLDENKYKIFNDSLTQELLASLELMFMVEKDFFSADEVEQEVATERIRKNTYEYLYKELKERYDRYGKREVTIDTEQKKLANKVIEEEKSIIASFLKIVSEVYLDEEFLEQFEEPKKSDKDEL